MATAAELQIILTAKDSASKEIDGLGKSLGALGGVGKVAAVGMAALATVGVGLAAGIGKSITAAMDFEAAMSGVGAVSGASASELAALSAKALQLGQDTSLAGIGATDAAQAMAELAAGGVSTQDILEGAAQGALLLASAGGIAVPRAAEIATNALNQFGLSGKDAGHVADLLAGAANASSADVSDLGESLKYVGPIANSMGLSIDEVVATLAEFGSQGIKGSQAGTALRSILASLAKPSNQAKDAMQELGLSFFDAQGHMKSIGGISEELKTGLAGLTDEQRANTLVTLFGNEALSAATVLYGEGAAGLAQYFDKVTVAGSAAEAGAKRNDNLKGSIEQLKSSLETASITLGTAFLPAVRGIVDTVTAAVGAAVPFIQQYGPVLVAALQQGIAVLAGFGQAVGQAALAVIGAFQAFITGQTTLAQFIGGMEIFVTAIRDKLAGLAVAAAPYIAAFFQAIAGAIAEWAPQIAAQFGLWALSFVDWIVTTAIPALGPPLAAFLATVSAWITGTALPAIQAQTQLLGTALADWVTTVAVPALQATMPQWVAAIAVGLAEALAVVQRWAADLLVGIGGALQAITPLFDAFFGALRANLPALQALWEQFLAAMAPLLPLGQAVAAVLGGVLVVAITGLLGILGGLVGFLTGALPGAIQVASGLLTALGGVFLAVQAVVIGVVNVVSALLRGDWAAAWQAATTAANTFSSAVQAIFSGFVTVVTGLITGFVSGAQAAFQGFVTATQGFFNALTADSTNQVGQMVATIVGLLANLVGQGLALVQALTTGIGDAFQALPGLVAGAMAAFAGAVLGALAGVAGSAGAAAAGIGQAIISGIVGGIQGGIGSVTAAAQGIAQAALAAAKGALDIRSPSKAMAEVGNDVVLGLVKGMDDKEQEAAKKAADVASSIAKAITDTLGALTALGKLNLAKLPSGSQSSGFLGALADFVEKFTTVAGDFEEDVLKAANAFADAAGKAVGVIKGGVEGLAAIGKFQAPLGTAVSAFLASLTDFMEKFSTAAGNFEQDTLDEAAAFADTASKVGASIGNALKGLQELASADWAKSSPTGGALGWFTHLTASLVQNFAAATKLFADDALAEASAFADAAGKVGTAVGSALGGLKALGTADWATTSPTGSAMGWFTHLVAALVQNFADAAKLFKDDALQTAGGFADAAGKVMGVIGPAITSLTAINTLVTPPQQAVDNLLAGIRYVVGKFGEMAKTLSTEGVKQLGEFSDAAGKALGAAKTGIDLFKEFDKLVVPSKQAIDNLTIAIHYVVDRFYEMAQSLESEGIAQLQAFATAAGTALATAKSGTDLFKDMEKLSVPSKQAIDNLLAGIVYVVVRMGEIADQLAQGGLAKAQAFATASKTVFDTFKAALDLLASLKDYKQLPLDAINGLIDGMRLALEHVGELQGMANAFLQQADTFEGTMRQAANKIAAGLALGGQVPSTTGGGGGGTGGASGGSGGGGKRAAGGPVAAGLTYIVGERGPELFVPGSAGTILPNGGGGGGAATIQNFYISGNTVLSKDTATQQALSGIVTSAQRRTIGYSI